MSKLRSLPEESENFHNGNTKKFREFLIKGIQGGAVFGMPIEDEVLLGRNCYFCINPLKGKILRLFETGPTDYHSRKAEEFAYVHRECYKRAESGELSTSPVLRLNLVRD